MNVALTPAERAKLICLEQDLGISSADAALERAMFVDERLQEVLPKLRPDSSIIRTLTHHRDYLLMCAVLLEKAGKL